MSSTSATARSAGYTRGPIRRTRADVFFDIFNFAGLTIFLLLVIYPLYFVTIASFSDPAAVFNGEVWLIPRGITFAGYEQIFINENIWLGYWNSLKYAVVGTAINVGLTLPAGYALSRKDLDFRNLFMVFVVFTMFFKGGLIPLYLLVRALGLTNTIWAMVLPMAIWVWNLIVCRTFFQTTIPDELRESSTMDGASDLQFFTRIVLPLSPALIAIMILFYSVGHWNSYFQALIYLRDEDKYPLQIVLRAILVQNQMQEEMMMDETEALARQRIADQIKYGVIIVASVPLLILYPFLQKYFVKGVMIGAIKG